MKIPDANHMEHTTGYYEHISPTAFVIAYERTFSDIPLSKEIYSAIQGVQLMGEVAEQEERFSNLAPRYEARYKLVNKLLDESASTNIVEIAPGMSPRGLSYTEKDAKLCYVELDLPHISQLKRQIVAQLDNNAGLATTGLMLIEGNALDIKDIANAAALAKNEGPVTFINEGLMRYFNFDEKRLMAENILSVLQEKGGVWITPDITLQSFNTDAMKALEKRVADISGVNLSQNYFENAEQAMRFYNEIGFTVTARSFLEVIDTVSSAKLLGMEQPALEALLEPSIAFVMSPS